MAEPKGYSWRILPGEILLTAPPDPRSETISIDLKPREEKELLAMRATFNPETRKVTFLKKDPPEERLRKALRPVMIKIAEEDGEDVALDALQSMAAAELASPDMGVL